MKIAFCLLVKGTENEARLASHLLAQVSDYVDGIFVTATHKPGEQVSEETRQILSAFTPNLTEFEWCNDFAVARNFNFSQVPEEYDYILWADADDIFRGLDNLRSTIELHPADAYSLFYLYAFDEWNNPIVVHQKTQVIRHGVTTWVGSLHEDFKPLRSLTTFFLKGIERIHTSTPDRFTENKDRNLEVALAQLEREPQDPRSYWNVANAHKALGHDAESLAQFEKFLKTSESDEEKYIARLRMAECLWSQKQYSDALDMVRFAIGLKPHYPDAYHLAGSLSLEMNRYEEAAHYYMQGLVKKPPYYSIIVYNPRDYDYVPMMNLAKTFIAMTRPDLALPLLKGALKIYPEDGHLKQLVKLLTKETKDFNDVVKWIKKLEKLPDDKLKKELEKVPEKYKSHPSICILRNTRFIKQESSGKDLVFMCGNTADEWYPGAKTGGSEEAIVYLTERLAEKGWNVTVYNNCGSQEKQFGKVLYKPYWTWNYRDKQDITILWRGNLTFADYPINSRVFVDLHDVMEPAEFTPERLKQIEKVFFKSEYHRSIFPTVPDEKAVVIPNGIVPEDFTQTEKDPFLLINTSSPDRSLRALVEWFPEVKKRVPEARCVWAYGWKVFDVVHGTKDSVMAWKANLIDKMKESGVEDAGRLTRDEVAALYKKASVFAYPTEFAEIDCISLTKAIASGAVPVTSDFAALGEKAKYGGYYIHSDKTSETWCKPYQHDFSLDESKKSEWVEMCVQALSAPTRIDSEQIKTDFSWERVAEKWNESLSTQH